MLNMNFSLSLKQHYDDLTDSEREVVSYLYDHMSEVKKMGIIEVAKKTLVSKSTVLRLSQKLGYSGFSEMKKNLTNLDVQQTVNQRNSNLVENLRIEEENFFEYLENIKFDMLTKVFFRSKNIYLYATGATQAAYLQIFYSQLILLNLPAKLIFGQTGLEAILTSIDDSDLLIVVSYGGETEHIKEPMRVISASGATVISVTSFGQNFLVKHAKYSLFYEGITLSNYNISMIQLGQLLDFLIRKLYK